MLTTEQWQRLYRQIDSVDLRSMLEVRVKGDPDGIAFVYGVGDDRTEKSCSQFLGDVLALAFRRGDRLVELGRAAVDAHLADIEMLV